MESGEEPRLTGRLRAYEYLRDQVLTDAGRRGTFLNEVEIAADVGVSRTPVREAFLLLAADGLVEMIPQRGAFIPRLTRRSIADLFEVRRVLECHAAEVVLERDEAPTGRMGDLLARQAEAVDADSLQFIQLDRDFHQALVDAADNGLLSSMYAKLRSRQVLVGVEALVGASRRADVVTEHQAILDALLDGDQARTRRAIIDHLTATHDLVRAAH